MKVFISADIEGVAGIHTFAEARRGDGAYPEFKRQMDAEVKAACEGALEAGATEILVKDAHGGANNLTAGSLPRPARLIRGWSGHPYGMVQGLDDSYAAALFIGYHARAGTGGNPLAHTMSSRKLMEVRLDGVAVSEYHIHALAAALERVPVVFVSGDANLIDEVKGWNPATETVATKWGEGPSQESLHPHDAVDAIRAGVERALRADRETLRIPAPGATTLELVYKWSTDAYVCGHYPGAVQTDAHTVRLELPDYFEALRALIFLH